ncbi:MAG: tyrosine-type recombinase/integrase [Rhodospirillaceae bacterium]|nr:tyrosine-type recombinase/integrase [Rhodospirillaceae bacterium]
MARKYNQLSPRRVSTVNKRGRYADGGGLYLQVSESGAKSWLFRYMMNNKARQMGLGSVRTFSLPEAREKATECRKLIYEGIDPIEHRKLARGLALAETQKAVTFRECAEQYISAHSAGWKNIKHTSQWTNTLSTYAYPVFGDLPVQVIDTGMVMKVLEPIWTTKTETASRVRGRIESILDWASVRKYREGENPARLKGHLDKLLPQRSKIQKVKHHPALPYDQIGEFMNRLHDQEGVAAKGLEFKILTTTRTAEVIGAKWNEIDFDQAIWTIPADRMKNGTEHRVPLSGAVVSILNQIRTVRVSDYVFPGGKKNSPLSNMAFNQLLKRMNISKDVAVPHGFRSTFRDWAAERTGVQNEVAEMALAHSVSSKVEAAYRRGDLFDKRRRLMDAWAEYCSTPAPTGASVVSLRGADNG